MIKPEFWDDEKLSKISRDARLTFIALWNFSDDYAVVKAHPVWLKNHIYPYDDCLDLGEFKSWLREIESVGGIIPFEASGESYYFITNFGKHQTINRPSTLTRNPEPPADILEHSRRAHGGLTSETEVKLSIKEVKRETNTRANGFDEFWEAYPKKKSKGRAQTTWKTLQKTKKLPDIDIILAALAQLTTSQDWIKENGRFIPYPATWLNATGWEDQIAVDVPQGISETTQHNITSFKQAFGKEVFND